MTTPNNSTVVLIAGLAVTAESLLKYLAAKEKAAPMKAEKITCNRILSATTNITW